jgi:hypothetical protein
MVLLIWCVARGIKGLTVGGRYLSITPGHPNEISLDEYEALVANHIMFKVRAGTRAGFR